MLAACCEAYGPPEVIRLRDLPLPEPRRGELLVRVEATTVSSADARLRAMRVPRGFAPVARLAVGLRRPRQPVFGAELTGEVMAVGPGVEGVALGSRVIAFPDFALGAHAEFCRVPQMATVPRPANLSVSEAAALCFGGVTALAFLRRADLQPGERILVHGAAGSVGSAAVQLARHLGAQVTAVCSARHLPLMATLGVEDVLVRDAVDFARCGRRWDVVMDLSGAVSLQHASAALSDTGRLVLVAADLPTTLTAIAERRKRHPRLIAGVTAAGSGMLAELAGLAAQGLYRPVIDRCYPLDRIVEAHHHVDHGSKRGNVVVSVTAPHQE